MKNNLLTAPLYSVLVGGKRGKHELEWLLASSKHLMSPLRALSMQGPFTLRVLEPSSKGLVRIYFKIVPGPFAATSSIHFQPVWGLHRTPGTFDAAQISEGKSHGFSGTSYEHNERCSGQKTIKCCNKSSAKVHGCQNPQAEHRGTYHV